MSMQFDPLETTAQELHRFWFAIATEQQWYQVMRECRTWFGSNWRSMAKVRRKFNSRYISVRDATVMVWFEVPDPRFATWISVKMSIQVVSDAKYSNGK